MSISKFILIAIIWLADMGALVTLAPIGRHAYLFGLLFCLGHVLMLLLVRKFPPGLSAGKAWIIILGLGVCARLLFLAYPAGNDVFRYVWEGHIQNQGFNPYVLSPASPVLADIARGELHGFWRQINHPQFTAAYPPFALLLFRGVAYLDPDPFFFKGVMVAFDIGVMVVLMLMLKHRQTPASWLLLYAANPLVLVYTAGEGHLDVIQLFFLCLAVYLILFKKKWIAGFTVLGLAVVSKYFALIAFPFLVNAENRLKSLAVFIPLVLYLPFIDAGARLFQSMAQFGNHFHYNDSIAVVIRFFSGNQYAAVTAIVLLISLAWVYLVVQDPLRSVYVAVGCLLLLLPTLHPWYLVLITPFLVFFPSRAWLYLQAAVVFTFPVLAVEYHTGVFQEIFWLKLFEYVPFYGLLLYGLFRGGYIFQDKSYAKPLCLSVVIPTLNESERLGQCLESLTHSETVKEIIVADGGSTDETRNIATESGARVVQGPKGRGLQIAKGVQAAGGDVIMIVHADSTIQGGVLERIITTLQMDRYAVGGGVGMRFEPQVPSTRLLAGLNNLRAVLTGICFGDQAQFFRAEALAAVGGFPPMMLMEDVELSLRLKELGRLAFLRRGIRVSGRRWQADGFFASLMTVFFLFPRYLAERRFFGGGQMNQIFYTIF